MILAVGASVRALLESAAGCGYQAMGIDFFGDVDAGWRGKTVSLTGDYGLKPTVSNLLEVAATFPCEGLVYAAGPENTPEKLAYWERRGLLRGNGGSVLTRARDPWELNRQIRQTGVRMPRFCAAADYRQIQDGKTWLLKALNRGGGHGVRVFPQKREAAQALISSLSQPAQFIIEEYKEGIPGSVTFLANGREAAILGTSRQLVGQRGEHSPFLYTGNIVPLDLQQMVPPDFFRQEMTLAVNRLTGAWGLRGVNTVDFIVNQEGVWVLELNPRWSASVELIEKRNGRYLFDRHLAACAGTGMGALLQGLKSGGPTVSTVHRFWGKQIVYARIPGIVRPYGQKQLKFLYRQGMRDIPRQGTRLEAGQPICTVLAAGSSDQDCERRLEVKTGWARQYFEQAGVTAAR
jgi:predicted ATP-grasp superfamily ATP-dependent carboligase